MKLVFILSLVFLSLSAISQELYTSTEPASNRAVGSIGIRVDNSIIDEVGSSKTNYHLIPDVMFGLPKKLMISGTVFFSNRSDVFKSEGGGIYAKYRFYSKDAVQRHFRMALFGRASFNNSDVHQEEISMYGHNTGMEAGAIATQLLRKVALSASLSFLKASDNGNGNKFIYGLKQSKAINYTFSIGKLILPKEYKDYRQTNLNLMLELLSQCNTSSGKYYLDAAPSVQLIFNSQAKLDVSYRKELRSNMIRTAPNGFLIRIEYNLFNAF